MRLSEVDLSIISRKAVLSAIRKGTLKTSVYAPALLVDAKSVKAYKRQLPKVTL